MSEMVPVHIGKYRIDGILGEGAMGIVYKAFDPHIERVVALKTVHKALLKDGDELQLVIRFKNEAQAAGRLTHQNIVAVYDYGETDDAAFIAMEFVEGNPLTALLGQSKPGSLAVTMVWMTQLLQALSYAHARGVVHRDIKPANLMIMADGGLKIADFGIARIESSTLTQTGAMIGTPSYMSPEQFRGQGVDGRSDVFSAGIVLYQLLTGVRPFLGNAATVMHQILHEQPVAPSQKEATVHPAFDEVVRLALEKEPASRFATPHVFLNALKQAHAQSSSPPATQDGVPVLSDDDRTMLASQIYSVANLGRADHPGGSPNGAYMPNGLQLSGEKSDMGTTATSWKTSTFPDLEAVLSAQIGPIAKVLLKRAGAKAENLDDLGTLLVPHIPSASGRSAFEAVLSKLKTAHFMDGSQTRAGMRTGSIPTRYDVPSLVTALASPEAPISDAFIAHAEKLLPEYIGAIAKIIIKRTLVKTKNKQEFLQAMSDSIERAADRENFMKAMQSISDK
jgi:serine/threonine protein kinase